MASPAPEAPGEDLDDALEAIFDAPSTPPPPKHPEPQSQPQSIPQTPESSPKKPPRKSILEHLAENSKRLTAGAARIAEDFHKLTEANKHKDNHDATQGRQHVSERPDKGPEKPSLAHLMAARRNRKRAPTKDAFTVIGRNPVNDAHMGTYDYVDRAITNMSLTETPYERRRLEAIFEHTPRLDVADIRARYEDLHTGALKDYTIFACLVKKVFKRQAKNGRMYAMWALCNMPRGSYEGRDVSPTVVRLLVFDGAYEAFHTRCEGTVFALRRPGILPKREGDREGVSCALRISKKENVVVLGVCKDFKLCEARRQDGELCGQWYHAHHITSCPKHAKKKLKGLTTGTRMDIQNAVRPNIRDPTKGIRTPMDISAMGGDREPTESGEVDRKRKDDLQRARDIRKRGAEHRLERSKKAGAFPVGVQGGARKKVARMDPMASVARETRQARNRLGERHTRLLGRSDKQSRYHEACETLYGLGFKLRADGGWDPPGRCDVTVVSTRTHKFSGLGRVQRRLGGGLGGAKEQEGALDDRFKNETETAEDDKLRNGRKRSAGDIEQGEEEVMDTDDGNADDEAKKEAPDAPPTLAEETKPEGESKTMETDDGEAGGESKSDTGDALLRSSAESKATAPPTTEENASTDNAEDIVLSDESEED